jgi:DNA-binding NtrC family response regulator
MATERTRILFVDDEPAIRSTFPVILEQKGFNVTTVASVSEALREIATQTFDALISDLNIGEPGDGFTVVSAMRRTQPYCVNFILTGFPAFETALQALRSQVDDYLVKPATINELVDSLEQKLTAPRAARISQTLPLADFMSSHASEIVDRCLEALKAHPVIGPLPLTDAERTDHIPAVLAGVVRQLRSEHPDDYADLSRCAKSPAQNQSQQPHS